MQVDTQSGDSAFVASSICPEVTRLRRRRGPRIDAIKPRAIIQIAISALQGAKIRPSSIIDWLVNDCRSATALGDQIIMQALMAGVLIDEVWIDSDGKTLHVRDRDDGFTLTLTRASLYRPIKDVKKKLGEGGSYLPLWKARQ